MEDFVRDPAKDIPYWLGNNKLSLVAVTNKKKLKTLFILHGGRMVSKYNAVMHIKKIKGHILDIIDKANERADKELSAILETLEPYEIPSGIAGECDYCGEEAPRLINDACPRCRDKYNLG